MIEGLVVALGLAAVALPFAVIWLVAAVLRLRREVRDLDARLAALGTTPVAAPPAAEAISEPLAAVPELGTEPLARTEAAPPGPPPLPPPLPAPEPPPPEAAPDVAPVGPTAGERLGVWLAANWIYVVSAVSLAFAGLFLLQYGAERGLLTPAARVIAALALGAALLAAGEVVRRRSGDEGATSTRVLPSTLSAAGLVVLYAAILAARGLYGLIGPEAAFAGLVATALVGLVFGWFYGPFLAAGALVGAGAAPLLVGGSGGDPALLQAYYGLLGLSGLAIDAVRRWGWVSGLTLIVALGGGALTWSALGGTPSLVALAAVLALAAVAVPRLEVWPSHPGPSVLAFAWARQRGAADAALPVPPTLVAWGGLAGASALLWLAATGPGPDAHRLLALGALNGLALVLVLWPRRAPGLEDAALPPSLAALAVLSGLGPRLGALSPWAVALALGSFLLVAAAAHQRSLGDRRRVPWAGVAALLPLLAALAIESAWHPAAVIGAWPWALMVMAAAAAVTLFAVRSGAGDDRRPAAYAALSALSLIALALTVLLSDAALTVALAVLVAAAAALDRRFRLPEVAWFVLLGVAALGWRLLVQPGLPAALDTGFGGASWGEVTLAFGSALAGLWVAGALLRRERAAARAAAESALLAYAAVFACVALYRVTAVLTGGGGVTHWSVGLFALIAGALALAQAHRARLGGALARGRLLLAGAEGAAAGILLLAGATALNPVLAAGEAVRGPWPLDTLLLAYAAPAAALALALRRLPWLPLRRALAGAAGLLGALWAALAIRRLFHGDLHWTAGVTQPELYAYTVALLAAGGILLVRSVARRSPGLRRLAMAVIALAIAKVFLLDAAGLAGLLRVFSFLALGLVLAGLAWLNRWAADRGAPPAA